LTLFPMYPQFSTTTTLSSIEDIEESLIRVNYRPKVRVIEPYYDNYEYIALIRQILKSVTRDEAKDLILYYLHTQFH